MLIAHLTGSPTSLPCGLASLFSPPPSILNPSLFRTLLIPCLLFIYALKVPISTQASDQSHSLNKHLCENEDLRRQTSWTSIIENGPTPAPPAFNLSLLYSERRSLPNTVHILHIYYCFSPRMNVNWRRVGT